jgi:hypothetical protein
MGKGDRRYKDRQLCSDEVMDLRWQLAFGNLTRMEAIYVHERIKELEKAS